MNFRCSNKIRSISQQKPNYVSTQLCSRYLRYKPKKRKNVCLKEAATVWCNYMVNTVANLPGKIAFWFQEQRMHPWLQRKWKQRPQQHQKANPLRTLWTEQDGPNADRQDYHKRSWCCIQGIKSSMRLTQEGCMVKRYAIHWLVRSL